MTQQDQQHQKTSGQVVILKKVFRYLGHYRIFLVLSLALAALTVAMQLTIPLLTGNVVDYIVGAGNVDFDGVMRTIAALLVCASTAGLAQWLMNLCNNKMTYGVVRDIRSDAFEKIEELPLSYIDSHPHGGIESRVIADADQLADGLLMGFTQLFTGVITIIGTLGFMLSINIGITIAVVILTPMSFLIAGYVAKHTYTMFRQQSEIRGEETSFINEIIEGQKVVKAFGRGSQATAQFDEIDERLTQTSLRAIFYSSITNPSTRFVNNVVYAVIGVTGALSVLRGGLTVGQLTAFLSYASQYAKPFNEISGVVTELQNAIACAGRVMDLIEEPGQVPDAADAAAPEAFRGEVKLREVSFSYPRTDTAAAAISQDMAAGTVGSADQAESALSRAAGANVSAIDQCPENFSSVRRHLIQDFCLSVRPGQRIAIVGPTGCGKTTIINLLMRFYDVDEGAIYVDGTDIRKIRRSALRKGYGMVLQDTWLQSGTIRDNITMGNPSIGEEEMRRIAKVCHIDGFVQRLPDGYDTQIVRGGEGFSQGQRQLLCIARVMMSEPSMLILDEATSSIDTRTELEIQEAFNAMMEGRTSFIVAHRLSTIRSADCILVMKDGQIIETGTHQELMQARGFYHDLYQSQFLGKAI